MQLDLRISAHCTQISKVKFIPKSTLLHFKKNRDINPFPHWEEEYLCRGVRLWSATHQGGRQEGPLVAIRTTEHKDSHETRV